MDLLYVLGKESQWGNHEELRYSIRSFEKHYPGLNRIFVAGHKPEWLNGVTHIPVDNIYGKNVPANIITKILSACLTDISDDFIFAADDYFLLSDTIDKKLMDVPNHGSIKNYKYTGNDYFSKVLSNTIQYLRTVKSRTFINCEAHSPVVINKKEYLRIMLRVPFAAGIGITPFTPYFNKLVHSRFIIEQPVFYINSSHNYNQLREGKKGKRFMCIANGSVSENIKNLLVELYPAKSKYEDNYFEVVRHKSRFVPIGAKPVDDDCGVMMIAFGLEYCKIAPALARSIREFSDIPICVHTNIPETLRNDNWTQIEGVSFKFYNMQDNENRVVKTQFGKYTTFKKTLYIDVDSKVLSGKFIELFSYLDKVDMVFPEWKIYSQPQLELLSRAFNFKQFLRVFKKLSIQQEQLISGGICCFVKNDATDRFFTDFYELWKWTERRQDMPGLNGALFLHREKIKYALLTKDKYNNTDSSVIRSLHSIDNHDLLGFTRTRINDRSGNMEYIHQGDNHFFTKTKICFIYDIPGWAFQDIALNIKNQLNDYYEIDVVQKDNYKEGNDYEVVICFSPGVVPNMIGNDRLLCGISSHKESNIQVMNMHQFGFTNDAALYKRLICENKYYLPNGVNTKFFSFDGNNSIKNSIGAVGTLTRAEHKGMSRIKTIAELCNVKNNSLFVGADNILTKSQMREYYKTVKVFVVSSISETGPLPLLEAMSMGIPPVVNSVGLVPELIQHGVNGYVVNGYESINQYKHYVELLLNDPDLYRRISINARWSAEKYDWSLMAKGWKTMIDDFLKLKTEKTETCKNLS